mgnify:FL=1
MKKKIIISLAVVVIIVVCCSLFLCGKGKHEISYDTAVVGVSNISNSVTATGTIEPVTSVDVGTQVSGIVDKIYVDYNTVVKKGQVIS